MRQATLVALYGRKPEELAGTIRSCQALLAAEVPQWFRPYDIHQVHATITGLESIEGSLRYNRNLAEHRGSCKTMDLLGFSESLQKTELLPLTVQIGGFDDRDYPFTSRNRRPYARSFSIQGDKAVLMGWPVTREVSIPEGAASSIPRTCIAFPDSLEHLRREALNFNILHSWHRQPADVDNDFYMRIGTLSPVPTDEKVVRSLETKLRAVLSASEPTIVHVGLADLTFVSYCDETLPLASSVPWALQQARVPNFVNDLYDDATCNLK